MKLDRQAAEHLSAGPVSGPAGLVGGSRESGWQRGERIGGSGKRVPQAGPAGPMSASGGSGERSGENSEGLRRVLWVRWAGPAGPGSGSGGTGEQVQWDR
jgi:hypothetical protein